jgi:hypothetical protein
MKPVAFVVLALFLVIIPAAVAQAPDSPAYGSKNTFSAFGEYANDSSHIILGRAPDRKFAAFGLQYERRLLANHLLVWKYAMEFRPIILESDPTGTISQLQTLPPPTTFFPGTPQAVIQCVPAQRDYSSINPITGVLYTGSIQTTCGHRWTYASGLSPFGSRVNLLPRHRLQPTGSFYGGYMLSTKQIPVGEAGSFNFTFEFGAGLEYFLSPSRSMRFEYQLQHFSNAYTAQQNPGVDTGLFKLSYTFGR